MSSDREIVKSLGTIGNAFFGNFPALREIQRQAIPSILSGHDVLVASPTASGKTEAILAPLIVRTLDKMQRNTPGIRVLVIAPTRALVNDMYARTEGPLNRLGLSLGRQTSDYRDKIKAPFGLITTPESLDSMLVRDARLEGGRVVGHLLQEVISVFIDEAHLFDGTARGDQLSWLLGRLRRLRRLAVNPEPGGELPALQLCAGSATVSDPAGVSGRLLGSDAQVVRVGGTREIEVFGSPEGSEWFSLDPSMEILPLRGRLEHITDEEFAEQAGEAIWRALSSDGQVMRKALVFVPTRRLCDTFSAHLARVLPRRRELEVFAHHGSLSRYRREEAEHRFAAVRDAVLVATTTLEVGIDIGDVDLVVLVGAPPDTRSLLQRIGRAGRRIGRTRVLALPRSGIEQAALASMLISARDGFLEPRSYGRRWSVFVQQSASFVAQGGPRGRRRSDLLELANDVWPESSGDTAKGILEHHLSAGCLVEYRGRLGLGEAWADAFDEGGRGMHANLDSSGEGIPVVDASTGETIAHVAQRPADDRGLALGGQRWNVQPGGSGEILLKPAGAGLAKEGFQYAARRAPTGLEYAIHVRRGLGLNDFDAPVLETADGPVWLHFGGSGYQTLLCTTVPDLRPIRGLAGLAVAVGSRVDLSSLAELASQETRLQHAVESHFATLEPVLSAGPFQNQLPNECRQRVISELIDICEFRRWIMTRSIWEITRQDRRGTDVRSALGV
ncbi:MAG: DEAD/DEAH box helicase [Chloroflexi bacterium]|nr:DEAD/DEAH box helicase [Chloroflexota bacterium]